MGNCGVGFAPVRPGREDWLIQLMEGVEDIPGAALSEGITWGWETFPEYLDVIEQMPHSIDIGTQVPHGAVRAYVMGDRGSRNEPATPIDIAAMAEIVREGIAAGALGFSTSRTIMHRAVDGEPVPGTFAAEDELFGIGRVLGELGTGVFELAPAGVMGEDLAAPEKEVDWMRRLAAATQRPVTFALTQNNNDPEAWRRQLDLAGDAAAEGVPLRPQVHGRTVSILLGFSTFHPFNFTAAWGETGVGLLPWAEQVTRISADPALRARLVNELGAGPGRRPSPRGALGAQAHPGHGHAVRARRPRCLGTRVRGRCQRHRLREPPAAPAPQGGRPPRRRLPAAADGRRLCRHHQERRGHLRGRRAHRGPPRSAPPRCPLTPALAVVLVDPGWWPAARCRVVDEAHGE